MIVEKHTCWDTPEWDGQMQDNCKGCDQAAKYPCEFCGYGEVFTTHNSMAHIENGDQIAITMGESAWAKRFSDGPYVESAA